VSKRQPGHIGGISILAPLALEEERKLYGVIAAGREAAASLEQTPATSADERRRLLRLRQAGQEAESTLLRATCGLVRARVNERGYSFGNEELEAAGIEALANALKRFDPAKGNRFATYANYWIMKLVNQAIQHQVGLSDSEMRLVLGLQKLERTSTKKLSRREIAEALGVSTAKVADVLHWQRELEERRHAHADIDEANHQKFVSDPEEAPYWVIDLLKRLCGKDFDAFWQYTFRTMSLEELARGKGISRQAMSKRIDRCRRAVLESPESARLQAWFDRQ
jgi:RNA polymerase sigma factor (sigma-70 family)